MAYLDLPTLVFVGDFQADVSTINNDIRHYDNSAFEARFQEPGQGSSNGWWNPAGGASFRFVNCTVKRAISTDGDADDPIVGKTVAGPSDRSSGKMVDLDPQMQMTSELWGVKVRIFDDDGALFFEGDVTPTGFRDLQTRQYDAAPNGQPSGAAWAACLKNVQWGEAAARSPVLQAIKQASAPGRLSLNLNSFGYYYTHLDGRFAMGRIIGAIGPWREGEPETFAATRRFYGGVTTKTGLTPFQYGNFVFNAAREEVVVDLGGSFPVASALGTLGSILSEVVVAVSTADNIDSSVALLDSDAFVEIATVAPADPGWLSETGGIVRASVSGAALTLLADHQLLLLTKHSSGKHLMLAREGSHGWFIRADHNVCRIDPGDTVAVPIHLTRYGVPQPGETIQLSLTGAAPAKPMPPKASGQPQAVTPASGTPTGAISASAAVTGDDGVATVTISGADPGNPRVYIDGQVYNYAYSVDGVAGIDQYFLNQIFCHLRDAYTVPDQPTWADIQYMMIQFGNLYPVMSRHVVDLGVREAVLSRREILLFAFTRDIESPIYMPVTRDMSKNKLATVVKWLESEGAYDFLEQPDERAPAPAPAPAALAATSAEDEAPLAGAMEQLVASKSGRLAPPPPFEGRLAELDLDVLA